MLGGCGRDDIQSYQVPKEEGGLPLPGLPAGHPAVAEAASEAPPRLTWTKPAGWNEVPPGQVRVASFNVKGEGDKLADVSVTPLPGLAGGIESNVNRWRGQVGLAALPADEIAKLAGSVQIGGQPASLYDLAGAATGSGEPTRILAAIQHRDGTAWFFKMTGDDALVAREKSTFIAFLESVKFEAGGVAARPPGSQQPGVTGNEALPAGHPDISAAPAAAGDSSGDKPKWDAPADWKEIPGGQFLVAKYTLTGEGGAQAAVNVSMSVGDGGGLAANVNRWRGQLGLPPWSESELKEAAKEIPVATGAALFVEMAGTDGRTGRPASLLGAMVTQPGRAWFYKLMGDAKAVGSQKAAFTKFVQTAKY
jgi:hypothetical protein